MQEHFSAIATSKQDARAILAEQDELEPQTRRKRLTPTLVRRQRGRARRRDTCCAATTGCFQRHGRAVMQESVWGSSRTRWTGGHYISLSRPRELAERLSAYAAEIAHVSRTSSSSVGRF
jgi:hypothetical protein